MEFNSLPVRLRWLQGGEHWIVLHYALSGHYNHSYGNLIYSEAVRNGVLDSIHILQQRGFPLQRPIYSFYSLYYSHLNNLGDYFNLPE